MLQDVLDAIDAQITKERSPVVNVLILLPMLVIVSLPLAFIVGTVVLLFTGTTGNFGQGDAIFGIIAGALILLVFLVWAAYGTYSHSKKSQDGAV